MDEVWRESPATVHSVKDALNKGGGKQRAYTTYMTILARLHRKGLLDRKREGKMDVYTPRHSREEYANARARSEVNGLVEEFGDVALVHFAKQMASLDRKRLEQLRRLARDA
mgnify:CR=1 FL=1